MGDLVPGDHAAVVDREDSMMLSIQHRMRQSVEFGTTVRRGVRVGRPLVVVHIDHSRSHEEDASSAIPEPARVGFVVGRGVGGAVVRNAVRRRLRHLMADRLADLPAGARVVVRARPEAAHSPSSALGRDLDSALAAARSRLEVRQ